MTTILADAESEKIVALQTDNDLWFSLHSADPGKTGANEITGTSYARQAVALNEVQALTITGTPTGGTFTLTYSGQTTAAIAYNASAATVQAALEALSNIAVGDVLCAGGALPGTGVTVTFTGTLKQTDVTLMTTTDSLTGGTTPATAVSETTKGIDGWTAPAADATSGGRVQDNVSKLDYGSAGSAWGTISHVGWWTAPTGGTFKGGAALTVTQVIASGNPVSFAVGDLNMVGAGF